MPTISLLDILRRIETGELRAEQSIKVDLDAIAQRDPLIKAFVSVDRTVRSHVAGPLAGIGFGVKDVFDSADLPTEMGSPIYAGWRPKADAFVVAALKAAGATLIGKTSTTPFAHFDPTPTRNPHNPDHTPGGSSSGSAAAVGAGMVPLAIGTQSSGSTIRPASFCGVAAMKPTLHLVPTVGLKCSSWSLDTVGLFAAHVADVAYALAAVCGRDEFRVDRSPPPKPRVGIFLQEFAGEAEPDSVRALERAVRAIEKSGVSTRRVESPKNLEAASRAQATIQNYELWRSLAWEYQNHRDLLATTLRQYVDNGAEITRAEYESALRDAEKARSDMEPIFAEVDVLLTYSSPGSAPPTLKITGDPRYNKAWTVSGHPCVNVPGLANEAGMPVGIQVVGPFAKDAQTLAAAHFVESSIRAHC